MAETDLTGTGLEGTTDERWIKRLEELGPASVTVMLQSGQIVLKRQRATMAWLAAKMPPAETA